MSDGDVGSLIAALSRDMSTLNSNLEVVNDGINRVDSKVDAVAQLQSDTRNDLDQLRAAFSAFATEYNRRTTLQLAQTQLIEINQRIEKEFGFYDEVRRSATGLLQGADLGIVREDTMRKQVESYVVTCPQYWLAPALVALVGWLADRRSLAEDALSEALKRSDTKTSLFLALVCRRARRSEASVRWLERYFQNQNPATMQREAAVMLDAVVNGAFGGGALTAALTVIDGWLEELDEQASFGDEQRKRWADALNVKKPHIPLDEYPNLRQHSPTWPQLESSLGATRRNQVVFDFFENLFKGEIEMPPTLEATIDLILNTLVTEFENDELPLRKRKTELQLLVDEQGDTSVADARYSAEVEALRQVTNFGAILTNAAMYPDKSGTTRATQRYAVSRSQDWIVAGFGDLVAHERAAIPQSVDLNAGSWTGSSRDGSNETNLVSDCERHYARCIEEAVNAVTFETRDWVMASIAGLIGVLILQGSIAIGLLVVLGAGAWVFFKYQGIEGRKQAARQAMEDERDRAIAILRAELAELVDLRRDLAREDVKAEDVMKLLGSIHDSQFIMSGRAGARSLLN